MIKVIIENTEEELKKMGADYFGNCICGGGYGDKTEMAVHIDCHLNFPQLRLATVHEILHLHLGGRIKHSKIDQLAIDLIDGLTQIGDPSLLRGLEDAKADRVSRVNLDEL